MRRFQLLLVAALWVALTRLTLDYGALLLPSRVARGLTHEAFLTLAQVVTTALGLGLSALALHPVRDALGLRTASPRALFAALLAAPAVFVVAMAAGIAVALPTLLAELRQGGAAVSRANVGELGRSLEKASLAMTLLWATVVAPLAEELLFRGAVWSAFQRLFEGAPAARSLDLDPSAPSSASPSAPSSLPPDLLDDGPVIALARRLGAALRSGGLATLASSAVFGAMHLGMAGGSGIVRVVSATCLGLACGTARHLSGGLAAPLVLHIVYNVISVGHARAWFVSETFPLMFAMPTLLALVAALALPGLALFAWLTRRGTTLAASSRPFR